MLSAGCCCHHVEIVELDDNTGPLEAVNKKQYRVARVEFKSPTDAKVNILDGNYKQLLVQSTAQCVAHWSKQFGGYQVSARAAPP